MLREGDLDLDLERLLSLLDDGDLDLDLDLAPTRVTDGDLDLDMDRRRLWTLSFLFKSLVIIRVSMVSMLKSSAAVELTAGL